MKVLFHFEPGPGLASKIARLAHESIEVAFCAESDEQRFSRLLPEAEVLWHVLKPVTAQTLANAPKLRLVQKIGTGLNTIDIEAARERGIAVANMPGINAPAVAEMTLALMLAGLRRLAATDRLLREDGRWQIPASELEHLCEVGGRTVGMVGFGAVPRRLAPILKMMGARLIYWTRLPKPENEGIAEWRQLDSLMEESDIVSLHLPLSDSTRHILNRRRLECMREGALLVNTARGGLVEETALIDLLSAGRLNAALDVFEDEPLRKSHPFFTLPNVTLSPHAAWLTSETLARSVTVATENCRRLLTGEPLLYQIV
ncbi:D-3-phosphoglycerate dehydrogenase [Rhodospirillaceae bacterium LM-1]|nr:D-3-phosphoglycerate dehydrogenase [Rhodospirillaceae bacterium LM-1]